MGRQVQQTYPSLPYGFTQPAHLAALAAVHGLISAEVEGARVLELGCATAGNLIPLAARFPGMRLVGVDLSQDAISAGRRRAGQLGLRNVELRVGNLIDLDIEPEAYDYVICHGVYSWVSREAQEAIWRICERSMTADALAVVSFNALPGWGVRRIARDLCLRYVGHSGTIYERAERTRSFLVNLAARADGASIYGSLLRQEARRIAHRPAHYVVSELLEEPNSPAYFDDVLELAATRGLTYLCEADLDSAVATSAIASEVPRREGGAVCGSQQWIDLVSGRSFRRSVFRRGAGSTFAMDTSTGGFIGKLHFYARPAPRADQPTARATQELFKHQSSENPSQPLRAALQLLEARFPGSCGFHELLGESAGKAMQGSGERPELGEDLMRLVRAGALGLSTVPVLPGKGEAQQPCIWPVARGEAAAGQPWLSNLRHEAVRSLPALGVLVPYMDGRHDLGALRERLADALVTDLLRSDQLTGHPDGWEGRQFESSVENILVATIDYCRRHALFEPDGSSVR